MSTLAGSRATSMLASFFTSGVYCSMSIAGRVSAAWAYARIL